MRLESFGTAGARRRIRYHCNADRPLEYRGTFGGDAVFQVHADDGRTYTVTLTEADMAEVAKGRKAAAKDRARRDKANGRAGAEAER